MGDSLPAVDLGTDMTAVSIAAGSLHTCALLSDGTVKCWGQNGGQLGLGHTNQIGDVPEEMGDGLLPVDLGTDAKAIDITASNLNTCATLSGGSLKCWGGNAKGQLGLGDTSIRGDGQGEMGDNLGSIDLGTVTGNVVLQIAGGISHTCALLQSGAVKCWGANDYGQLGQEHTNNLGDALNEMGYSLSAINLGTGRSATAIAAGESHTCVVLDNGTSKCWGSNSFGQLGQGHANHLGDNSGEMGDNLPAIDLGTQAIAISAGYRHTCGLLDNGTVRCWGNNDYGQLGQGQTNHIGDVSNEMGVNLSAIDLGTGRTAIAISGGGYHTCALLDNLTVRCWGLDDDGRLGSIPSDDVGYEANEMGDNLPAIDLGTGRTATAIVAGEGHTCALLDNGSVRCWGNNDYGQLGQGHTNHIGDGSNEMGDSLDIIDLGSGRTATAIASRGYHTCALLDDSTVKCWGSNNQGGQLGQGHTNNVGDDTNEMGDNLDAIQLGTGMSAMKIAMGVYHSCALLNVGTLKCWGNNSSGELGLGHTNNLADGPNEMGDSLPNVPVISAGPDTPSMPDLSPGQDSGASNSDNITYVSSPTLSGISEADTEVELYRGGTTSLGTTTSDADGNWSMIVPSLSDDLYSVTARGRNESGPSTPSEILSLTVDTVAPSIPSIPDLSASSDSNVSDDNITTDTSPTFTGTADLGAIVYFYAKSASMTYRYSFGTDVAEDSTYSITSWTYGMTGNTSYLIEAVAEDIAGNRSATSTALMIYVENAAPVVGTVTGAAVVKGQVAEISAAFTDASPQQQNRSASVDWGDGITSPGSLSFSNGSGLVTASHTYTSVGTYMVAVTVTDAENMSDVGQNTVTVSDVPPQPTDVSATPGDRHATVLWTAPISDGGSSITGYTVISSPGGITATTTDTSLTVTGLANGTAYTFTVTATNSVGTSASSAASNAVTPAPPTPPVAYPQQVNTTVGVPVTITLTGSDVNGDTLGWAIVNPVNGGTTDYVAMSRTTNTIDVVFTPFSGFIGTANFRFYATDDSGAGNTATVTINVSPAATPTPVPASVAEATPTPIPNIWDAPSTSGWGLAALVAGMLVVMVIDLRLTSGSRRAARP